MQREFKYHTKVCIAGGGPAGIMLGYLLARTGTDVYVLEKWPDFFRDFRGDTIHPSTMQILHELGILEKFLSLPHQKTRQMVGHINGKEMVIADLSMLKTRCPYIAFIPQWDFLNFLTAEAKKYPTFHLLMETDGIDLIKEGEKVTGVVAKHKEETFNIKANLVVGADGRHSTIREKSGLKSLSMGSPIDVLWFKLKAQDTDPEQSFAYIENNKFMVTLDRGDYWQCGYIIAKGRFEEIKKGGLDHFKKEIADLVPFLSKSVAEIQSFDEIKLLSVTIDRLEKWWAPGLLMIGDAAHAMSPLGGVGINLAIADAVAAANVLVPSLVDGTIENADFVSFQKRREFPTRFIQGMQVQLQDRVFVPILESKEKEIKTPLFFRLVNRFHFLRYFPARFIGLGVRAEHIKFKV